MNAVIQAVPRILRGRMLGGLGRLALVAAILSIWTAPKCHAAPSPGAAAAIELGGNVNESLDWLLPSLLDQSHTSWVRGFVPAFQFMRGERTFGADPGLAALNAAARSGRHVILSIKWDCVGRGEDGRVPLPDSPKEKQWFRFADDLLRATSGNVSILVLENELTIDAQRPDLEPQADGRIPMIVFLQRLAAHLASEHLTAQGGGPLPLYAGGWTRLDLVKQQLLPVTRASIQWINQDPDIAGADYHLHQPDTDTTQAAMEYIHRQIPHKPLIVTEFSLIWKWKAHLLDPVAATPAGQAFLHLYNLPAGITVSEFLTDAFRQRVPQDEWNSFIASQAWYQPHYLQWIAPRLAANGVVVATYAFTLNPLNSQMHLRHPVSSSTTPWFLNDLFVPTLVLAPASGGAAVNDGMFDSYLRYQEGHRKSSR